MAKKAKKTKTSAAGRRTMTVTDKEGVTYTVTNIRPKARTTARTSSFVNFGGKEKQAPLPTSCHYSRNAAKESASKLRDRNVKARVVTSGKYFCVYTVGKCKKGSSI
jgi:hypothetical protein